MPEPQSVVPSSGGGGVGVEEGHIDFGIGGPKSRYPESVSGSVGSDVVVQQFVLKGAKASRVDGGDKDIFVPGGGAGDLVVRTNRPVNIPT